MTADLPDTWDAEPWPLDDPVPTRGLNPVNWSDTHDTVPQVADLADEAWEYAIDHGVSMEVALAELQRMEMYRTTAASRIISGPGYHHTIGGRMTINGVDISSDVHSFTIHTHYPDPTPNEDDA